MFKIKLNRTLSVLFSNVYRKMPHKKNLSVENFSNVSLLSQQSVKVGAQVEITQDMLLHCNGIKQYVGMELTRRLVDEIINKNIVEIKESENMFNGSKIYTAELVIIPSKNKTFDK